MKTNEFWRVFIASLVLVVLCIFLAFVCFLKDIKIDKLEAERDNYKLLYELSE